MLHAATDRLREEQEGEWKRALSLVQAVYNTVERRPKSLDHLWPKKVEASKTKSMSLKDYRKWRKTALRKIKKKHVDNSKSKGKNRR